MVSDTKRFPWDENPDVIFAESGYMACAYNAAVNYGTDRGVRKMGDLIRAINHYERTRGAAMLAWLQQQGVIETWQPCPPGCVMRPGGLFHADGCENDGNSAVSRGRREAARETLPSRLCHAASPSLVGSRKPGEVPGV